MASTKGMRRFFEPPGRIKWGGTDLEPRPLGYEQNNRPGILKTGRLGSDAITLFRGVSTTRESEESEK